LRKIDVKPHNGGANPQKRPGRFCRGSAPGYVPHPNKDAPRVLAAALMILLVPLEDVRVEAPCDHLDGVGDGSIWVTNVIT